MKLTNKPRIGRRRALIGALGACALLAPACSGGDDGDVQDIDAAPVAIDAAPMIDAPPPPDEWEVLLSEREYNYSAALRTAALRLTGDLPTLAQIKFIDDGADLEEQRLAYESQVQSMLNDPRFANQMFKFWKDTFRMGDDPVLDTAPSFATQLVVEERPFTMLLTASVDNCPTFNPADGTFTVATCDSGVPAEAGVLTNRGVQRQFFSNLGFRRVRWIQETFDCTSFPAEISDTPQDVGGPALYTGEWPYEPLAGADNGGRVDFRDVDNINCGNCHLTMNHIAPLIGKFDADGMYVADGFSVPLPTGEPTEYTDWMVVEEGTGWRAGIYAADLPALGQAMANDPEVIECMVARVWNWGLGHGDIVNTLSLVPSETIAQQLADFQANDYNMRELIYQIFISEDFTKY